MVSLLKNNEEIALQFNQTSYFDSFKHRYSLARLLILLTLILSSHVFTYGQCDVTVDVPADITICEPDDVDLEGIINGSESCFNWISDQGYFNDSEVDLTVFVDVNTTFTFTAYGSIPGPNLITNGDFEGGDDGSFTTDYLIATTSCASHPAGFLGCEGVYEIMDDPSLGHNNFDACAPMGSLQMVVNGAASQQLIWCQDNILVEEGKKYEFSAWAQSVNSGSPALLQFSIDGDEIGDVLGPPGSTCQWVQVQEYWISTLTGAVEICVLNQNTSAGGNDFAIDDIFFGELCSDEKELNVSVGDLTIDPDLPDFFDCNTAELELSLNADGSFQPFTYQWSNADFNIIDDDNNGNAFIYEPGLYMVEVTDAIGCGFIHFFDVEDNLIPPEIDLGPIDPILLCDDSFINIFNDFDDVNYEYEWYREGDLYSDDNILQAGDPGLYEVTVTDVTNGCTATSFIDVGLDADLPVIEAYFSNPIDCNNPTSELIVDSQDIVNSIEWYDADGNLVTNTTVSVGGFYSVVVEAVNGCIANDFIEIPVITFDPQITINQANTIDCNNPTSLLSINYNGIFNLNWTGPNSFNESGNDIVVDTPGTYFLVVTDDDACSVDVEVEIYANLDVPILELTPIPELDCNATSISVGINNYDPSVDYNWTFPDLSTMSGGPMMDFSSPGDVTLVAINPNGCFSEESFTILSTGNFPTLNIEGDDINCNSNQTLLSATGNYSSIEWSDSNGPINNLEIETQGWYYATAGNGGTCVAIDSIYISVDTIPPAQSITIPTINCDDIEDLLFNSLDEDYNYEWTLPDGTVSLEDSISVDEAGNYTVSISADNECSVGISLQIQSDVELPQFEVEGIVPLSCNNTLLELSIDSISELQSILLTDPDGFVQDNSLIIVEGGQHMIEVTGTNGCTDSFPFVIEQDTVTPNPILQNTNINCIDDEAILAVTNPQENVLYTWSNAAEIFQGDTFMTDIPGMVLINAIDTLNGCETSASANVTIDMIPPTLTFQVPQLTCAAQEAEINLFPDGDYEYEWILPNLETESGMFLIAKDTGDYQLFLTGENGCTNEYLINVIGNIELPEFEVIQPTNITCIDTTTVIAIDSDELLAGFTATHEDGFNINFGNGTLTTPTPGLWSVQVTAASGCTNTAEFEIFIDTIPPSPQILVQNIDCLNTQGSMSISDEDPLSNFEWIDADGNSTTENSYQPDTQENIMVIETAANGCIGFDTAMITIDTISPNLSLLSSLITCNKPLSTIEVDNPEEALDYEWNFDGEIISNEDAIESDQTGTYSAIVTNPINHCFTESLIEVDAEQDIPFDFDFSIIKPLCGDEKFFISSIEVEGGIGPYQYSTDQANPTWQSDDIESILFEGSHFIQIQDSNGCVLDTILNLSLPESVEAMIDEAISISWATDTTLQLLLNKPLEEIESIEWTPSIGLSCDDCPNPVANLTENQAYQVIVVDENGCEDIVEIRIDVVKFISVFLPNIFTPNEQDNDLFFPFSTEQHITKVDNFYIFDRWGNQVFTNSDFLPNDPTAAWDGSILGSPATPGVYTYVLEIFYDDGSQQVIAGDVTLIR